MKPADTDKHCTYTSSHVNSIHFVYTQIKLVEGLTSAQQAARAAAEKQRAMFKPPAAAANSAAVWSSARVPAQQRRRSYSEPADDLYADDAEEVDLADDRYIPLKEHIVVIPVYAMYNWYCIPQPSICCLYHSIPYILVSLLLPALYWPYAGLACCTYYNISALIFCCACFVCCYCCHCAGATGHSASQLTCESTSSRIEALTNDDMMHVLQYA
jgi:hypothetical protein